MKSDDAVALAIALAVPMLGGQLAGLACVDGLKGWYQRIKKPRWTPPGWVFGAVWPVLYIAQGVSSFLVWRNPAKRAVPLTLYGLQLLLNFAWTPLLFKLHRPVVALADCVALLGVATAATVTMAKGAGGRSSQATVAALMSPYVAWLAFATALNARIAKDNPEAHKIDSRPVITPPGSEAPLTPEVALPKTKVA